MGNLACSAGTAILLLLALGSRLASAQVEGSEILRGCGATVKQADGVRVTDREAIESIWCTGYISGITDGLRIAPELLGQRPFFCMPQKGVSNDQIIRVIVKYLRENPEQLHQSGRSSALVALTKAFPCR